MPITDTRPLSCPSVTSVGRSPSLSPPEMKHTVTKDSSDDYFVAMRRGIKNAWQNRSYFRAVNGVSTVRRVAVAGEEKILGSYFVTSEKGLYAFAGGQCLRVCALDCFGVAVRDGFLYLAGSNATYSSISRAKLPGKLTPGTQLHFEEIYRVVALKSGRIHQIGFYGPHLAISHTSTNSVILIDPGTGEQVAEGAPFLDAYGIPIRGDHNHINSVSQAGECLLFSAYRAGEQSLLGVMRGGQVRGYAFEHRGVHDIYLAGETFYFSDTFGQIYSQGEDQCGFLMADRERVDETFFRQPGGLAVRGLAQSGNELLAGHSHKGRRAARFKGNGSLIRLADERGTDIIKLPFAQVYDIARTDGAHFTEPPSLTTWDAITARLETLFGKPILDTTMPQALPTIG